jgi:hypothetical protein
MPVPGIARPSDAEGLDLGTGEVRSQPILGDRRQELVGPRSSDGI